jgi:hypothetical protein
MTTRLTPTGIIFNDNSVLSSKFDIIAKDSKSYFFQPSAPPRWVKLTQHNNKALRVVSGTGGGSGGVNPFSSIFPTSLREISNTNMPASGSVGNHTLNLSQITSHQHTSGGSRSLSFTPGTGDIEAAAGWNRNPSPNTGLSGGGSSHNHPWSGSSSFSQSIDLRLQYIDIIECIFEG